MELEYPLDFDNYKNIYKEKLSNKSYIPRFNDTLEVITQAYKNLLLLKCDIPLIDIIRILRDKYSLTLPNEDPYNEMQVYLYTLQLQKCFNKPQTEIISRYNKEEIDFNVKIRIELYKEGWNPIQIENYMYKNVLKKEFNYNLNVEYYNILINNIFLKLGITRKEGYMKVGRPPLPPLIKSISKEQHLKNTKDNMRKKYSYATEYENIKDYLFTKEEVDELLKIVTNKELVNKIKRLRNK